MKELSASATSASAATASPIGVALLGFGFAGQTFHAPFITTTPGLVLRVVASRQPARVRAAYPDVDVAASPGDAMAREDVTLVVVATPNDTHAPLAEAALRAGKHVVVDKPFTITLEEAQALAATARETGRVLSVYQNRRWDSDFRGLRDVVQSGLIGDVVECVPKSADGDRRSAIAGASVQALAPGCGTTSART